MAANMICRGYHLGRASFPLCAQASSVLAGSKAVSAGPPSRPRFAFLAPRSPSVQDVRLCAQEQEKRLPPEPSRVEDLLESCSTPQEVLHLVDLGPVNGNKAAMIITRLSHLLKGEPGGITEEAHFRYLLKTVAKQVTQVTPVNLVHLLKSLSFLGLTPSSGDFCVVEKEVAWRLRQLSFRNLLTLVDLLPAGAPKDALSTFQTELVRHLELRWREVEDPRSLLLLATKAGSLSPNLMRHLEDKALEMSEQFTPEDFRRLAMALAHQNLRSVPLLRAISYYVIQKQAAIGPNVLLDLVFAYGKLSFHQTQLFQKIAMDLQPHIPELTPEDTTRCIKSFAYLKWLNLPLFEAFAQHIVNSENSFTLLHLSNIVLSFARLNFHPSNSEAFYGMVHRGLESHLSDLEPYLLVDLVWSLCVLQQASAAYLEMVLTPKFHIQFLVNQSSKGQNYLAKLIAVNAAARLECAGYEGPLLSRAVLGIKELLGERAPTPLQSSLKEVLKGVAGGDDANLGLEVDVLLGWPLAAVMVLDADDKPLPVADWVAPDLQQPKPLPPGAKRLAFLRWEFPNFSNRSKELLGRFAMARRHVQAAGFLVVDVPFYEWNDLKTERQKAAYLKNKMSKAVAEEMAR